MLPRVPCSVPRPEQQRQPGPAWSLISGVSATLDRAEELGERGGQEKGRAFVWFPRLLVTRWIKRRAWTERLLVRKGQVTGKGLQL